MSEQEETGWRKTGGEGRRSQTQIKKNNKHGKPRDRMAAGREEKRSQSRTGSPNTNRREAQVNVVVGLTQCDLCASVWGER